MKIDTAAVSSSTVSRVALALAVMLVASALLAAPAAASGEDTEVEPDPIRWVYDVDTDDQPPIWIRYDMGTDGLSDVDTDDQPPVWIRYDMGTGPVAFSDTDYVVEPNPVFIIYE